jgi:hypothetical protein
MECARQSRWSITWRGNRSAPGNAAELATYIVEKGKPLLVPAE